MKIIALIPARGGSKGIKRKNLVEINGKSLVQHSIEHALGSKSIDRTIVSTDDEEIKNVSLNCGAEVPFLRPKELAEDQVLDHPVFIHTLDYLKEQEGYEPDLIVHLRPTAPFRKSTWIDDAIEKITQTPDADSLRSVSKPNQHPYRVFRIAEDGFLDPIMKHEEKEPYLLRRQDLPDMYYYNCVIDITRPSTIYDQQSTTGKKYYPLLWTLIMLLILTHKEI